MTRMPWARTTGMIVVVACALAVGSTPALACSCAPMAAAERLATGQPAVIGEVVAKHADAPVELPSPDEHYTYTVRVERALNGGPGGEVAIRGNTSGATCGFSWSVGQRVGAFLSAADGAWHTGLCNLVAPEQLEQAADTPPSRPPDRRPDDELPVGRPGTDAEAGLRARRGRAVVAGGPRAGALPGRLVVAAGTRIRLRLDASATAVRTGLAGPGGTRLTRMRAARAVGHAGRTWVATLPGSLPHGADRLLVAVERDGERDGERVVSAVGVGVRPQPAGAARLAPAGAAGCPLL